MKLVRTLLLCLSVALPLTIGECFGNFCTEIPDQPHQGICDPFRS